MPEWPEGIPNPHQRVGHDHYDKADDWMHEDHHRAEEALLAEIERLHGSRDVCYPTDPPDGDCGRCERCLGLAVDQLRREAKNSEPMVGANEVVEVHGVFYSWAELMQTNEAELVKAVVGRIREQAQQQIAERDRTIAALADALEGITVQTVFGYGFRTHNGVAMDMGEAKSLLVAKALSDHAVAIRRAREAE